MAAIELREKQQEKNVDFDQVSLEDGTTLDFSMRSNGGNTIVRCSARKDDKEIGYGSWNTAADKFYLRIEPMSKAGNVRELAQTIFNGIMQVLDGGV